MLECEETNKNVFKSIVTGEEIWGYSYQSKNYTAFVTMEIPISLMMQTAVTA
jgi:hypothetical protein